MRFPRSSGILLHPTSLPGRFGIGDFGEEAYKFANFLAESGQSLWQLLPLGPTGFGDSPYQCFSAFAGKTTLISPERLVEDGLLSANDIESAPSFSNDRVEFGLVIEWKNALLARAFEKFTGDSTASLRQEFEDFKRFAALWLDDYAFYRAIKDAHGGAAWNTWDWEIAKREPTALASAREKLQGSIQAHEFFQFLFFKQWMELKRYCNRKGLKIIGDMPIFVAYDSADVWIHPELFKLDKDGSPTVVAGVPPDYFSKTGQLWGNPLYDWEQMRALGFRWWIERVRWALGMTDVIRIDHFRGFAACWEIPFGDETAEHGKWIEVPGRELFAALNKEFGVLPIIAEDLGVITPDVEALRDDLRLPGMRVLQFAFGGDANNAHLPHNYVRNATVYTGTHDSDTVVGWFNSKAGVGSTRDNAQINKEHEFCLEYLNSGGQEIHWDFIRAALASVADVAIVPLQDLFGLDSRARMNLPASEQGNWGWRFNQGMLTPELSSRLKEMTELYGRALKIAAEPHSGS
ncbi:MAG TPA: 4-alpha-glucanotransferase [Blastocatellia bacterium]|nr:4-alpha-glucanotransferase [Blastocatellia bacterium]